MRRISCIIAVVLCGSFFLPTVKCRAENVDDNFRTARTIESKYFNVSFESGVRTDDLLMKVSVPSSIAAIIKEPVAASSDGLLRELDTLYLAVCEIMDISLRSFKCKIKVCRDADGLSAVAEKLFGKPIKTAGFYVFAADTLYVNADSISINILGHELSHAIQSHYFVVPPPVKIQEVLAGYVEFQLRKYADRLPK